MPQFLNSADPGFEAAFAALLGMKREDSPDVDAAVAAIIADVRARGDAAVLELTARFDRLELTAGRLAFTPGEIEAECARVSPEDRAALELAAERIRAYHLRQMPQDEQWTDATGAMLGWRWTAVSAAGLYVPGGLASYPSSVLMNAIPARVAGVERLVIACPTPGGAVNPLVLLAARIAGVDTVYRMGGAQAIAALAYGTATVAPVDKITGPGNAYVTAAKKLVMGDVGIDMLAGPSEVLILADETAEPMFVAIDLMAQAEHDPRATTYLVTTDEDLPGRVELALRELLAASSRADVIERSLTDNGVVIVCPDIDVALDAANTIAPEHLEVQMAEPFELLGSIRNAGAIFLGPWTPESVGDYVAGPNHVLPTGGTARFSSPLSVDDFVKKSSVLSYSLQALEADGATIMTIAEAEGLEAHAAAVGLRLAAAFGVEDES